MRRTFFLPREVAAAIRQHIAIAVRNAVAGFESAHEDEDTLTGHLGAKLQSGPHTVYVPNPEVNRTWRWSLTYYKFRGRGPRATEKFLGADGIFELTCRVGSRTDKKSLLFQSKLEGAGGHDLLEQCVKLSTWREAAFVLNFRADNFYAVSLDNVLATRGDIGRQTPSTELSAFLGGPFLDCTVGDDELNYRARERKLAWRAMNGEVVAATFSVKHRLKINVQSQDAPPAQGVDRELSPEEIYKYRMQAADKEILRLSPEDGASDAKKSQRLLTKIYHPDAWSMLEPDLQKIMQSRMQEVNVAAGNIKKRS